MLPYSLRFNIALYDSFFFFTFPLVIEIFRVHQRLIGGLYFIILFYHEQINKLIGPSLLFYIFFKTNKTLSSTFYSALSTYTRKFLFILYVYIFSKTPISYIPLLFFSIFAYDIVYKELPTWQYQRHEEVFDTRRLTYLLRKRVILHW